MVMVGQDAVLFAYQREHSPSLKALAELKADLGIIRTEGMVTTAMSVCLCHSLGVDALWFGLA